MSGQWGAWPSVLHRTPRAPTWRCVKTAIKLIKSLEKSFLEEGGRNHTWPLLIRAQRAAGVLWSLSQPVLSVCSTPCALLVLRLALRPQLLPRDFVAPTGDGACAA